MKFNKICVIVLDSVGIGALPDAADFGDQGAHTLRHIAEENGGLHLPHLAKLGLGNIDVLPGVEVVQKPLASFGKMAEASAGKDTMTGHWELMGLRVLEAMKTYPQGFPLTLLDEFEQRTGRGVLGNRPASGTAIIAELGEQQLDTGKWIVYTSADSVFQIAAHEDIIPLDELYRACEIARELTMQPEFLVGRVIARPYKGRPGEFKRTTNRKDYALQPPDKTILNELSAAGFSTIAVGKINDIFSGSGITANYPTKSNEDGMDRTIELLKQDFTGLLFVNLVEFDSLYGHRRDPQGYASALQAFDARLPELMAAIGENDLLLITADHGNDPTHSGTDHTREYVPLLAWSPAVKDGKSLGIRTTFADVATTVAANFGVKATKYGTSFLNDINV